MTLMWPWLLALAILVPVLIGLYLWVRRRRRPAAARYSSLALIRDAGPSRLRWRRHAPFAMFVVAIGALTLAAARPVAIVPVPANQTTILLTMDVSRSMCATDIKPSRLEAAQEAAAMFVNSQASGTQIGIVAFSSFAAVVQAPTSDRDALLEAIRSLTTGRGTAVGSGIIAAIDGIAAVDPNVQPSTVEGRPGVKPEPVLPGVYVPDIIVLLTDGASNRGIEPLEAAQQAADRGVRVYTIGFGTESPSEGRRCPQVFVGQEPGQDQGGFGGFGGGGGFGGPGGFRRGIDEETLKSVAELTGGTYSPAESASELQEVFADLPTTLITKLSTVEVSVAFVALGGLLAAAALLLGRAWRPLP